jgi:hypothetical protein
VGCFVSPQFPLLLYRLQSFSRELLMEQTHR